MGLSKNRRGQPLDGDRQVVAAKIAARLLSFQRGCAHWLNRRASKLGQANVLVILMVLGLGFGLWFGWLVVGVLL